MGITWNQKAIERIICALLAAHPRFTPDYASMAVHFGQGATYHSMQYRFREYRRIADSMRQETPGSSIAGTPVRRTAGSGRVSKPNPTVTGRRTQTPSTPTKCGKVKLENGILDDLLIGEGSDYFAKPEYGGGILFAEASVKGTSTPEAKKGTPLVVMGEMKSDYDTQNDFLSGLENVTASLARESEDVIRYSSGVAGFAEYDDTV
ncbi:hypothetical protein ACJ72_01568 [Emergomyces africanus]|uniref:Uncharacterized protein n=1 Tax=Emergomyces africanus TaxID=1955775 RepID=A0A1B7P4V5_9EURO|nr:hypothetical protein ACJ72_01568 [Emergomyces africanus]